MRDKKAALLLFFVLIMALLYSGCSPGDILSGLPVIESISNQIGRVGQEFTYQVIAYDTDSSELTYSLTEKPEGMQIGSSTGLITWTPGENQIGTFTVKVKVSNGNGFSLEQFEITIEDVSSISASLTSITVLPSVMSIVVGNYKDISSVTAHYDGASSASVLDSAKYSSNDTNIASASTMGRVTGVSAGSAIVTVSYTENGITKTDTVNVTVEDISLTSITVLPSTMTMYIGSTKSITSITAHYDDGSNVSIELSLAAYQSSSTNATVNNNGLITGVSTGAVIITVSYTEDGITQTDTVSVTVISPGGGGGG